MATEPSADRPHQPGPVRERKPPELSARLLAEEVEARGLTVTWVHHAYFRTTVDGVVVGFWCARTNVVSAVADMTSGRKDLAHGLLRDAGFNVPDQRTYYASELDAAIEGAFELAPSLVVKPARGRKGRGVTVGVTSIDEFRSAWQEALQVDPVRVVVEGQVSGREVRFLVVGGQTVAAVEKRPPTLVGDGARTIAELVEEASERRRDNEHLRSYPLELDAWRLAGLEAAGLTPGTVLAAGQAVVLDRKASLVTGGESIDVTDTVHPSYKDLAGRIADAFPGLGIAGVDIVTHAPEAPVGDHVVLEVNSMPGLGPHHYPLHGTHRNVAAPIVEYTLAVVRGSGRL